MAASKTSDYDAKFVSISPEVQQALQKGLPIVALESTVISHGLPFPENLQVGRALEAAVRAEGSVPCTIALIDGRVCLGLTDAQLERLAENAKPPAERSSKSVGPVHKVSVRDIAWVIARGECGATTVAATAFIAARHGIRVFATGGIGGVHKDGHISMDISADLQIMSQINIAIVCAGAKSILDLPRTLEYLETAGVNVVGYGTKEFPAFFTRTSGLQLECSANNATEVATMLHHSLQMGVRSATLVCVPISAADAADGAIVQDAISKAMREADEQNVHGKAVTPFLLKRIAQLTKGVSLRANVALLKQNAKVAGQIASQLANVQQSGLSPRARY